MEGGRIAAIRLFGDYMGRLDVSELENTLRGTAYDRPSVAAALGDIRISDYVGEVALADLLDVITG